MGFWSNLWSTLFGGGQRAQKTAAAAQPAPVAQGPLYAPGTRIAYDGSLVGQLQADHQRLLALFTDIRNSFLAGDVAHATAALDRFKSDIQAHLLVEEVRLYVYLQNALANDELNHSLMRHMHREMASIGNDVLNFLGKYNALDKSPELQKDFAGDLDKLGEVLVERIKREETLLYPMYMPPAELNKTARIRSPG